MNVPSPLAQEDGQVVEEAADGCELVQYSDIRFAISVEVVHRKVCTGALRPEPACLSSKSGHDRQR